ncbi:zinc finger protein 62 [Fopius arisanus]|uniref:Zinc finger protein 62 n=1 Tax=Fopius arisanus TaxID=64838 RepID=A0A9R1TRW0_9HYME|nr:PREDICTED: zinc finger protein 62-like [Fopius arisanus]XP_011313911.1 PREDICTED: zinc finger protein 62-like [Fopius arisanus]
MSHRSQGVSTPPESSSISTSSRSYITKNLNGCVYYTCSYCCLISLDQRVIEQHIQGEDVSIHCHKKLQLQCFGCENVFFSRNSLLSHAIHDHQMTESCAVRLISKIPQPDGEGNTLPGEPEINKQDKNIEILRETHESAITDGRLDISIPLEQEIINDLNDCEDDSDEDDYRTPGTPEKCSRKKNPTKKTRVQGFRCETEGCNVRLLVEENILYHERCHNAESRGEAEAFKCPECQEFLCNRWNTMAGHLWRSHLVDVELHTCDLCNYKTPSLSRLINQHRGIHGDERPFVCEYCGKGFKTSKQLRTHRTSHKSDEQNTFECDKCQRVFKTCRLLKLHCNSVHRDCKPFTCHFCDFSAATRSGLKLHLRRHTGEKPFSCDQCAYSTGDHNSIRRHKLRHLGLKPYNCPHCNYACIQSSTYKVHLKNKHPGLNDGIMFSCKYCPYRTVKQEKLLTHITIHTESSDQTGNDKD